MFPLDPLKALVARNHRDIGVTAYGIRTELKPEKPLRGFNKEISEVNCVLNRHGRLSKIDLEIRLCEQIDFGRVLRLHPVRH